MKKIIVPIILCLALIGAGAAMIIISIEKEAVIEPVPFGSLSYNEILPDMYIASDETVVYGGYAYFGESEYNSDIEYYVTITGLDTPEGAQYMGFAIPSRQSYAADAHIDKTLEWLQDETLPTPTGYPIKGVVKEMSSEMRTYFEEFFTDNEILTQEEIDQEPTLLSYYYIDTEATPGAYAKYKVLGSLLIFASAVAILLLIIVAASNKNKARYVREHAVANTTNINLDDSTDAPLGFDK